MSLLDRLFPFRNGAGCAAPPTPTPAPHYLYHQVATQALTQVPPAVPLDEPEPAVRELIREQQRAEQLERMQKLVAHNNQQIADVVDGMSRILKGFSPTALAKVVARDAELEDLITKALFLTPAFKPEKPDDPAS